MQWYYVIDGERQGPVGEQEMVSMLSDGSLKPEDLVWNETFSRGWLSAREVPEFNVQASSDTAKEVNKETPKSSAPQLDGLNGRAQSLSYDHTPHGLSCTMPVGPALERMKNILFRPFDIGKWFALGFSAWLATLGQSGGGGNSGGGSGNSSFPNAESFDVDAILNSYHQFMEEYPWIVPVVVAVVVAVFVLGIAFEWLRARGKFMFLDNVVNNRDKISEPWKVFKQHGNSLFLWNICYSIVCLLVFGIICGAAYFAFIKQCIDARAFLPSVIPGMASVGVLIVVFMIIAAYVSRFLEDFVVPIMYKHNLSATEAWGRFLGIMRPSFGTFFIYGLFYCLLVSAAGIAVMLMILMTCCIALCPMSIPYVGSVLLLPLTVFFRAYSLEYFAQFGEEFDLRVS